MFLHGIGHFHPDNLLPNSFFEKELGLETSEDWILERVGIRARHTVLPLDYIRETRNRDVRQAQKVALYSNAQTGKRAALMAVERAGIRLDQIGLVIAGGCSPDECIPAEACRIAEALGLSAPSLDVNAACSSFCVQVDLLAGMRPERLPDYVLVVNPENSTRVVDYTDRSSAVLWGDGTSAAVFSPRIPGPWRVTESLVRGEPSGADKVKVPRHGHFIQDGAAVHAFAVRRATEVVSELKRRYLAAGEGRSSEALRFIGHQANLRMLEGVARRCEVSPEHHLFNIDRRGNCGASGAPTVFSEHWGSPALGDAVAMAVVGSGLTWAGVLLERVP